MKFMKRPIVVEANQWSGRISELPLGARSDESGRVYVVTIHNQMAWLEPGDWVIQEPDGERYYPCKPDVFAATYEPVEETA